MPANTLYDAMQDAKRRFDAVSSSPALDAQLLMAHVLNASRAHVIAHKERILTPAESADYESLVARREEGEPLAYILGRRAFYDREFIVTPAVLIPRPETEHLVEAALDFLRDRPRAIVVDVATGSGAIIVTLKGNVPHIHAHATDISADALDVARRNAEAQNVAVAFYEGDLLTPVIANGITPDLVTANLPYIASGDLPDLAVTKHEPRLALDGGADGLDLVRRLLDQVAGLMRPGGGVLLEIGADQGAAVRQLATGRFASVRIDKDYAGHDRVASIFI